MKYLELFEQNKEQYILVSIIINCTPEFFELFKEQEDANNYLINIIHDHLSKNDGYDYLDQFNDPTDVQELLDFITKSEKFDDWNVFVDYIIGFSEKVEINPELKIKFDAKKYNI